jgi:galactose oxidase
MRWTRTRRSLFAAIAILVWRTASAQSQDPSQVGSWTPVRSWPSATHTHLLPTGVVMFFGEFQSGDDSNLWDPTNDTLTPLPKAGYNIFCAGHTFLADGKLLVAGGHADLHVGLPQASLFDPFTGTWTRLPDMNDKRWYPSSTTLPNGDALVISGETDQMGVTDDLPQVYQAATGTWRDLTTAVRSFPFYPREFVAPNGKVFVAGPQLISWYLDTAGTGSWTRVADRAFVAARDYGPAVLYRPGKILFMGGHDPPSDTVEAIDLDAPSPAWRFVSPMSVPRRQHNATLLPDGRVLVTGGSSGPGFNNRDAPALVSEVWDPATESWTTWASLSVFRGYHSTALLLPDGRVLSAGGNGAIDYTMEVFSPPYLFRGPRPAITRAPETLDLDEPFQVETPDAGSVAKVSLIRLGSVTHAFDENQRFLPLEFTWSAGALTVRSPATSNLAPPGHYMLFLVDVAGVPSVAKIVRLSNQVHVAPPAPQPPPTTESGPGSSNPPPATGKSAASSGCTSAQGFSALAAMALSIWLAGRTRRSRSAPCAVSADSATRGR